MQYYLQNFFINLGIPHSDTLATLSICLFILIISIILYFIIQKVCIKQLEKYFENKGTIIAALIKHKVIKNVMLTVQTIIIFTLTKLWLPSDIFIAKFILTLVNLFAIVFGVFAFFGLLDIVQSNFQKNESIRRIPIRGIVQAFKIIISIIVTIILISILVDKSPTIILSGLGAMTAIFMLVFKDPIMGFVAGIQLSANNMLHVGDWLQMDKYGADGEVMDITLTTVKIKNFDNTTALIPASALISDSFINWQGMVESGGRRIKRSIYIDTTSVHFLTDDEYERLSKIQLIKPYLADKKEEITQYNKENGIIDSTKINGRHLTNLGIFRIYLEYYIRDNKNIHKKMTSMVRQLAPTHHGLPIEIYAFTTTTAWSAFENIQSDIFDHIFAIVPEFSLKIHQVPSGNDMRALCQIV